MKLFTRVAGAVFRYIDALDGLDDATLLGGSAKFPVPDSVDQGQ